MRSAFSHYVAAAAGGGARAQPRQAQARRRDARGLLAVCRRAQLHDASSEGLTAEELIRFLNRLFTPLSEVILAERGTIDKFMGDAVMAFWNAPLARSHHASNACRAALRMQRGADRAQRERGPRRRRSAGRSAVPVRIGIGLNTGECCVGNVGSPQRFDYSILGDVVNVASRLEETTKTYAIPIIAGETTAMAAPELAFLEIDAVKMRGKERSERIFALHRRRDGRGLGALPRAAQGAREAAAGDAGRRSSGRAGGVEGMRALAWTRGRRRSMKR